MRGEKTAHNKENRRKIYVVNNKNNNGTTKIIETYIFLLLSIFLFFVCINDPLVNIFRKINSSLLYNLFIIIITPNHDYFFWKSFIYGFRIQIFSKVLCYHGKTKDPRLEMVTGRRKRIIKRRIVIIIVY